MRRLYNTARSLPQADPDLVQGTGIDDRAEDGNGPRNGGVRGQAADAGDDAPPGPRVVTPPEPGDGPREHVRQLHQRLRKIHDSLRSLPDARAAVKHEDRGDARGGLRIGSWRDEVAHVGEVPPPARRVVMPSESDSAVREHFRYLEHRLRKLRQTSKMTRILVTSSVPQEGKTVVARNLAVTLGCGSPRVILVDADLRAAGRGDSFGRDRAPGLADLLEGTAALSEATVYLEALKIYYVPAGHAAANSIDLLQSPRMRDLMRSLDEFEWVILDSPPVGAFADALSLAVHADGIILVTRAGLTRRADFERTLGALEDYTIAGVALNACDRPQRGYYYDSYYRYRQQKGQKA